MLVQLKCVSLQSCYYRYVMDNRLKRQAALYMLISLVDENNGSIDINSNAIRRLSHRAWHRVMEKQYYIYNIVTFSGSLKNEGFKVDLDDGKTIEKLKDSNGNKMKFNTPAAALMYLYSLGWELYVNGATTEGAMYGGIGASETTSYWVIRKPCTKEKFDKAVEDGIRK